MKTNIIKVIFFSLLLVVNISLSAQVFQRDEQPEQPSESRLERGIGDEGTRALETPPDDPSAGGNQPVGGPVGEGLLLLMGMGALYGVRKLSRKRKNADEFSSGSEE